MSHTCTLFLTTCSIFAPKFIYKPSNFQFKTLKNPTKLSSKITCSGADNSQNQNQQLNLSVLRFTLGIPGLDESYLPRWIGYAFGSLLVLDHFASSNPTPAQLRTEVLGLSLAAFSVTLPYIGQFLKGASPVVKASIPEGAEQIFAMSRDISDTSREDLAWGSYTLLRNTNSISLITVSDVLCVRGYWNTPKNMDISKDRAIDWFKEQIQRVGLVNLTDMLYFPKRSDSELWDMLPEGTRSVLVLPVIKNQDKDDMSAGFVLLASSINYAYSNKDRAWIAAIANKFLRS
ncbi:protein COFACTOR ASSEMBLY OF COMPLEX C SUBUNIT B CCB2, chloroplastic-like isoform X2 [Bidens hawaiensis]|uniref:protein COFACTOR ASSEMBLY OF COMPLEX C SUBUNIT B CCB2, chloroplastic-like isoform X2 n=1 Tax=Bidens hawaiensis TaxID=980011 RepID=UPI00404AFC42